jgi:hypothetical protein
MYHDVEIDAYGRAGYEDLIDVFMKKGEVEGLATSFFSELEQTESAVRARPTTMFFSIGSPELEVDSLIALHINNWSNLIRLLYSRLREEEEAWVKGQVAPIDRGFFIENIRSNESVESNRKRMLEGASLIEVPQQSVTYIARNRESFAKFYETFKEEVFRPAAENLPEAKVLKESIDKGLQKKLGRGGLLKD